MLSHPPNNKLYQARGAEYNTVLATLTIKRIICHIVQICKTKHTLRLHDFGVGVTCKLERFLEDKERSKYMGQHPLEHLIYNLSCINFAVCRYLPKSQYAISFVLGSTEIIALRDGLRGNLYPRNEYDPIPNQTLLMNSIGFGIHMKIRNYQPHYQPPHIPPHLKQIIDNEWGLATKRANIDHISVCY